MTVAHESLPGRIPFVRGGWSRYWPYIVVTVVFATSRLVYRLWFDVQFDSSPVYYFIQYIGPWFVEHDFVRSLLHLHQQAPLQNLMTGGFMRIFGIPAAFKALAAIYVVFGLTTVLGMLHAMLRLGVFRPLAAVSAALYSASPVTVLYENWLFYHMPVAALLLLSLVLLLRYYRTGAFGAGLSFFSLYATAALFYAMLSSLLLVVVALALLVRPPSPERRRAAPRARLLWALSIPLIVLMLDKARTQVLVGHSQGEAFLWENLAVKTFDEMRPMERQLLIDRGSISRAPGLVLFSIPLSFYGDLRIPHAPTGVPLLDFESTPDGRVNAHAIEKVLIAEKYYKKDAFYLLWHAPGAYWHAVLRALTQDYFRSPVDYDDSLPSSNRVKLRRIAEITDRLLLPDKDGTLRLLVVALPATWLYGLFRVLGARGVLESERSTVAAISYMLLIVAYVTLFTAFIAVGDFSRYRFNLDPFYMILFALMATDFAERLVPMWRWGSGLASKAVGDEGSKPPRPDLADNRDSPRTFG